MTFEHKIIASVADVKAVIFQCNNCGSKMSIPPNKLDAIPDKCPNGHGFAPAPPDFAGSIPGAFITSIKKLSDPIYANLGFKILLEFDGPNQ